ncbi:MAG TPA: FtsX-like permease family protein [Solirubrobacteraceae bacterium]|nr:FtsX-like permease family protein [Solirubrobacteraceae bacterium]
MAAVALKGLLRRKARAVLTAIAIVLGVAMVSGTYILTDTIKSAFSTVFTSVYKNTDAVITGRSAIGGEGNEERQVPPSFPAPLLAQVRALPDVAQASGGISDRAQLVGRNGKVISRGGAPALAFSYQPGAERFNPLSLASGNWPSNSKQVAIDASTASKEGFKVGQPIGVVARGPAQRFTISGTVKFGGVSSLGGATMSVFTLPTAEQIFDKQGRFDSIQIAAKPGVSPQQLVAQIRPLLPPSAQVRTGQAQAQKSTDNTNGFLNIFKDFLLAFGGVALFVGSFVIANTLSITIAQRTRELATLRTLGATRRQVLRSVLLEAFVIGLLASIVGLFLGLGLAKGLNSLLVSFGIDLPQASTVFATRTVIVSLLVGVVITMLAALRPALRSTRVPPIAAVREGAVLPPGRFARLGAYPALTTVLAGLALMVVGALVSLSTGTRLLAIGVGAVALLVGVAMLAPRLVPPLVRVLGWPARRFGAAAGSLASANSTRNPARTASTASALMIGLALVTFVGVLAAGLRTRFERSVNEIFVANYALTASNNFSPISIASAKALATVPGVEVVTGVRAGTGRAFGSRLNVTGVSPDVNRVIHTKWLAGGSQAPASLGEDGAIVTKSYAKENHLRVGSPVSLEVPNGQRVALAVRGIYEPPKGGATQFGDLAISTARFDGLYSNPQNVYTFIDTQGGVTPANTRALQTALAGFPDAKLQTKAQFKKNQLEGLNLLLNLLYVLLSLSIVVSLFGIVNTLVLTVFERTRELGMLRAVGMARRQVRRMIRYESVITALLGAAFGIPLGIVLALLVGVAIKYAVFTVPVGTLVVFVIAAVIAGMIAAIFPARRAARLNVLEALQYE